MSLRLFKSQFRVDDITRLCQNFKILRKRFHKLIIHFKISYTCYFHVSINIGTRNTNLNLFDPVFFINDVTQGSQKFKILRHWFQKRILYLKYFFTVDFHLFVTYLSLYFEKVISETNSSLQSFMKN